MTTQQIIDNNQNAIGNVSSLFSGDFNRLYDVFSGEVPVKDSMDFALDASFYTLDLYSYEMPDAEQFEILKSQIRPLCLVWPSTGQIVADKSVQDRGYDSEHTRYRWYIAPEHKSSLLSIAQKFGLRINHGLSKNDIPA